MEFLKSYNLTPRRVLIIAAVALGALLVFSVLQNAFRSNSFGGVGMDRQEGGYALNVPGAPMAFDGDDSYSRELSMRNVGVTMPPYEESYATGDSEAFEVKNYNAHIETGDLARDCGAVAALKSRSDVIFENTSTYDNGCSFTFKVEKASVDSVLSVLKGLNPKELNEQVYTIKREVDDYTSEIDILTKKLASLDAAYAEATAAYSSITDMATRSGDVENLAKIIESKLSLIERLTASRMQVAADLERMSRAKADSLDRLTYTYFNVSVTERVYVDGEALKDSWRYSIEEAVGEVNRLLQEVTVGLVTFLMMLLKFLVYAFIVLIVVRFGWGFIRETWGKMRTDTNN